MHPRSRDNYGAYQSTSNHDTNHDSDINRHNATPTCVNRICQNFWDEIHFEWCQIYYRWVCPA